MSERRSQRWLWGILVVALALRLGLLAASLRQRDIAAYFTPDSRGYCLLAEQLGEHGRFAQGTDWPPEIFRTPGYPAFLAGVFAVYGLNIYAVVMMQILLDVLLCWLTYRLGKAMISPPAGLVAAAVQAITPSAIAASERVLSESLFALLLTAGVLLLVKYLRIVHPARRKRDVWPPAVAGLALGAACLVRPAGLPVIAIAAIVLLFRPRRLLSIGAFCLAAAACVGPWVARNYVQADYPRLSSVVDYNLFFYDARALIDARPDIPLTDRQRRLLLFADQGDLPDEKLLNDPAFVRMAGREGRALILAHPLTYLGVHLRTTAGALLPGAPDLLEVAGLTHGQRGTLAVLRERGLPAAVRHYFDGHYGALALAAPLAAIWLVKLLAAAAGAVSRLRVGGIDLWLALLVILYFVLSPGPPATARFRVPIEPLLSVLAAATLCWVFDKLARRRAGGVTPRTRRVFLRIPR